MSSGYGGKRKGAGRPAGSVNKLKFTDFFSPEDAEDAVIKAKELVKQGDRDMIKYVIDQWFGKAKQSTELTGKEGEPLKIMFDNVFKDRNDE